MIQTQLYIDGQWQSPIDQGTRAIVSPADESVIAQAAEATRADARLAIAAARKAFDGPWRQTTIRDRARLLNKIAELIDRDAEKLAHLESLNTGKTLTESRTDMGDIAATFRYFAGLVASEAGAVNEAPHHVISRTLREPVGVCGLITPWNYPLLQAAWKIAPALGAGNTVVIKPSNLTPLTTHHFTQLVAELDLPPGVFNLVTGGAEVGAELAESLDVDLVSFTGGAFAGESIMKAATGNFKRIGLELGGKNPNIVFADADLDAAVDYALNAAFFHAGHLEMYLQYECTKPVSLYPALQWWNKPAIGIEWYLRGTGTAASNHFEAGGFIRSSDEFAWPNLQYHFIPLAMNYDGSNPVKSHGFQCHVGSMRSPSTGFVKLASRDPRVKPRLLFNYMAHDVDWREFRAAVRLTREIIGQQAMDQFRGREIKPGMMVQSDAEIDAFVRAHAETALHPSCTCKMGDASDPMAVVDNQGRVHGLSGLRVVDASIMPKIVTGNLNAPTIMMAEKLADVIRGRAPLQRSTAPYYKATPARMRTVAERAQPPAARMPLPLPA